MEQFTNSKVLFIAGFGPIVRDAEVASTLEDLFSPGPQGGKPDRFIIASVALKTPSKSESTWMRIRFVPGW
jgi:hypothetical protein